jgi:TPR repeat protein
LELRLADGTVVDRKSLRLEWSGESAPAPTASAEPSQRHLGASEITFLMKRGAELMANGDVSAARMAFQPAAEAGVDAAAFALAETYDPLVLKKLGVIGAASDAVLARQWYEKAAALGSTAARERLLGVTR